MALLSTVAEALSLLIERDQLIPRGLGIPMDELKELRSELELIKPFWDKAYREPVGNKRSSDWLREIKEVFYEIEDLVDSVCLRSSSSSSTKRGTAKLFTSGQREIAKDISLLTQKVKHLILVGEIYGLKEDEGSSNKPQGDLEERSLWESDDDMFFDRKEEIVKPQKFIIMPERSSNKPPGGMLDEERILDEAIARLQKKRGDLVKERLRQSDDDMFFDREEEIVKSQRLILGDSIKELPKESSSKSRGDLELRLWQSDDDLFVDREEEIEKLQKLILDESTGSRICITGMAGVGKTSLAKMAYNGINIRGEFQVTAWFHVGTTASEGAILVSLLQLLESKMTAEMPRNYSKLEMCEKIYNTLQSKRCLTVLDDVRSVESWDSLESAFPSGKSRSKLLVTSRMMMIADIMEADAVLHVQPLSDRHSLELIDKKGSLDRGMAKALVNVCSGLPLVINVVRRLLASPRTVAEWQVALNSLSVDSSKSEVSKVQQVLSLSFDTLPERLKPCFLYFGAFPDEQINAEKLFHLWIAEGFIVPEDNDGAEVTLMDIAEKYLDELAIRGLVKVKVVGTANCIRLLKSCRMHDLLRDLCILKAREQSFCKVIDGSCRQENRNKSHLPLPVDKTRRVCFFIREKGDMCESFFQSERARYLRTLLCFNGQRHQEDLLQLFKSLNFNCFELLRVLYFNGFEFPGAKLPDGIERLISLRYLSFNGCRLEEIPESIGQLSKMEILDLRIGPGRMAIPNVLWQLRNIRHLYLPRMYEVWGDDDRLRLDTLKHLQTLENFDLRVCRSSDLIFMPFLCELTVTSEGCYDELDYILRGINASKRCLRRAYLYLDVNASTIRQQGDIDEYVTLHRLFSFEKLHALHISGFLGELPLRFSSSITVLVLKNTGLHEDPMPTLGKLPNLYVLVLASGAFLQKRMVCLESSFKQLENLKLEYLDNLQTLIVVETAMPELSNLTIEGCPKLQLPELHSLTKLRKLKVNGRKIRGNPRTQQINSHMRPQALQLC